MSTDRAFQHTRCEKYKCKVEWFGSLSHQFIKLSIILCWAGNGLVWLWELGVAACDLMKWGQWELQTVMLILTPFQIQGSHLIQWEYKDDFFLAQQKPQSIRDRLPASCVRKSAFSLIIPLQ